MPAYIKFDGIDGDVLEHDHKGWIEILSYSWGVSNPSTVGGGGAGAGKVQLQDFHFVKPVSTATPPLMESCCQGKHFPKVEIHVASREGMPYLKYELQDVLISSLSEGGSGDERPMDQLSLSFEAAAIQVAGENADGQIGKGTVGFCDGSVRRR
jgi:type VI secretion system secreted protein Hcp